MKRIVGIMLRVGAEEHRGWLPPGAATPPPTPVRDVLVDLDIESDGGTGYLLICTAQDGSFCWDNWHRTLDDATQAAAGLYGVEPERWRIDRADPP